MSDCLFCKISAGEMNTEFVYEDDKIVVFPDINPKADTHLLVVPKIHIESLATINEDDNDLLTYMITALPNIATVLGIKGFRTIINTGSEGGQVIFHLHFHLLAGNLPKFG